MKGRQAATRGAALPLVIIAMIVLAGFVITSSTLNQGMRTQLVQTDADHFSFILAYSALSRVLGQIHADSWNNRPFRTKPMVENNVPLNGGFYDLWVENSPGVGKKFLADVYIRTTLGQKRNLYFWRIRFLDDLLDVSNRILIDFFKTGDSVIFPTSGGSPFASKIDDLMNKRKANQKNSNTTAASMRDITKPQEVLGILGGRPMNTFPEKYPLASDSPETLVQQREKNPVPPPVFGGPNAGLPATPPSNPPSTPPSTPPTAPPAPPPTTPEPGSPATSTPDPAAMDKIRTQTDTILQGATDFDKSTQAFVAQYSPTYTKGLDALSQNFNTDLEALDKGIRDLMSNSKALLNGLPTAEAAKPAQDLIANTLLSGMQSMSANLNKMEAGCIKKNADYLPQYPYYALDAKFGELKNQHEVFTSYANSMMRVADQLGSLVSDPAVQEAVTRTVNEFIKFKEASQADYDKALQIFNSRKASGR